MKNELFQDIFDAIQPMLPTGWSKMILYVCYTTGSYSMKFYTREGKAGYTDCFSMMPMEKAQLIKLFMKIDRMIAPERNILSDKWSVLTLAVDKSGNMKADFDYTDINENAIEYERKWKDKYLV